MTETEVPAEGDGVLIVVPCLNEEAHLPALLDLLIAGSPRARIVVADGGSHDRSRAIVQERARSHPRLALLDNPARIQSAGVNAAVRAWGTGHRWLVRVDAHCSYGDGFVTGLLAAAARTGADSVVVPMRTIGRPGFQRAVAAAQNSVLGTGGSPHRHVGRGQFVDHGHHALCRLALFCEVGGYDETFVANEDAELDHRIGLAGGRIWLEPALAIDYYPRSRPLALLRQYVRYGSGRAKTLKRHRMRIKARQLLPLAVPPAVLLACAAPAWPLLALPGLIWATACLVTGARLAVRRRERDVAASGFAAMLMHLGWGAGFWRELVLGGTATSGRLPPLDVLPARETAAQWPAHG